MTPPKEPAKVEPFEVMLAVFSLLIPSAVFAGFIETRLVEFGSEPNPLSHRYTTVGLFTYHIGEFGHSAGWRTIALLYGIGALASGFLRFTHRSHTEKQFRRFVYSMVGLAVVWTIASRAAKTDLGIGHDTPYSEWLSMESGGICVIYTAICTYRWCREFAGRWSGASQEPVPPPPPPPPSE